MATNVELYRGLCEHIPPEAARLIAEALPPTGDLATRSDVLMLRSDLEQLGLRLTAEMHRMQASIFRWMLGFFASLWVGLAGLILAVVLGG